MASDSWAEDPISDAELIALGDAADNQVDTQSHRQNQGRPTGSPNSRVNLLRNAINSTMHKEMRSKQGSNQVSSGANGPSPGDKRGYDGSAGHAGQLSDQDSYASVAADDDGQWLIHQNKRNKRNSGTNVPELYGVKQEATRDIFVRQLNYANCRKPEDLELLVKYHCRRRGIDIVFAKAFTRVNDKLTANCKVTLKESDVPKALDSGFWPEYVKARYWLTKDQYLQANNRQERAVEGEFYFD